MLRLLVTTLLLLLPAPALAQVVFDGSMGPGGAAPTRSSPGFANDYLVTYDEGIADPDARHGRRSGPNLFQSLDQLDLGLDDRVSFQALDAGGTPIPDLERVIARITSGDRSVIEGVLRSEIPGADLFLLNPAGIDFLGRGGSRRQLDLQGGFTASTADFLRFDDDSVFDVADLDGFTLSAAPLASFGFLGEGREEIRFDRAGIFEVPEGEDLTVVAGDVTVTGFASRDPAVPSEKSLLLAPGGTIQAAAVGDAAVEVPVEVADWATRDAAADTLGDIVVEAFSEVRTEGAPPAGPGLDRVVLRGGRLVVDDSLVVAGGSGVDSLALDAELTDEIAVREDARLQTFGVRAEGVGGARLVTGRLSVSGSPGRASFVGARPFSTGTSGAFRVDADEVVVSGDAALEVVASNGAQAGELAVNAGRIEVTGPGGQIGTRATCPRPPCGSTGAPVSIDAQRLELRDGGAVRSVNFDLAADGRTRIRGAGRGGDLMVRADELVMEGDGRIEALAGPAGDGGDIVVDARSVDMASGSEINATTINDRDAGDITVTASERIALRGDSASEPTGVFARSGELDPGGLRVGSGNAGIVSLTAPTIDLEGAAVVSTRSRGTGSPGSIEITAPERLSLTGTEAGDAEIAARAQDGITGGAIVVDAGQVLLESGGRISASTAGTSPGGRIHIEASTLTVTGTGRDITPEPSQILSDTSSETSFGGDAGAVEIHADTSVVVDAGAQIGARTRGGGNAGSIAIGAEESVVVSDGGAVTAAALGTATGEAGDVAIEAPWIVLDGGAVTTEAANGTADGVDEPIGGDIDLKSDHLMQIVGGSLVSASSFGSQDAGRITLDAGQELLVQDSSITTDATVETQNAAGGQIDIFADDQVELVNSTVSTSVRAFEGDEDGGNVLIDPDFVIVNASDILAQAQFGDGGQIRIIAGTYLESADSLVDASSLAGGIDGVVDVEAPEVQLKGELVELPARFFDASALLREHCAAQVSGGGSFVVAGTEGSAASPARALPVSMPLTDEPAPGASSAASPDARGAPPPERTWLRLAALDCAALARELERRGQLP